MIKRSNCPKECHSLHAHENRSVFDSPAKQQDTYTDTERQ
jgi:hypothetical protein